MMEDARFISWLEKRMEALRAAGLQLVDVIHNAQRANSEGERCVSDFLFSQPSVLRRRLNRIGAATAKVKWLRPHVYRRDEDWNKYEKPAEHFLSLKFASDLPSETRFVEFNDARDPIEDPSRWRAALTLTMYKVSLRRIRLYDCSIGDEVVEIICRSFPLLVWINLRKLWLR